MASPRSFEPDEIRRHAAWLRSLAHALVGEAGADDVAQDAWMAALRARPGAERPLRPWLARVARNLAFQRHRRVWRRTVHEAQVPAPEEAPDPAEVAERLDAARVLLDVFETLREPYKNALYLRYWHDLAPREIAERIGVPAGTVRWRLSEGLAELRRALDARGGGAKGAWCALVAPLLRTDRNAAPGALATTSAVTGVLSMNHALKIGIAITAVALLGVGFAAWRKPERDATLGPSGTATLATVIVPETTDNSSVAASESVASAARVPATAEVASPSAPGSPTNDPRDDRCTLVARFVDERGASIAGVAFTELQDEEGSCVSDDDGVARLLVPVPRWIGPDDAWFVSLVAHARGLATRWLDVVARSGETIDLGAIVLEPGGQASGRVVDNTGDGVAGATVACLTRTAVAVRWQEFRPDHKRRRGVLSAVSDVDGRFHLEGLPRGPSRFMAVLDERSALLDALFEIVPDAELEGVEILLAEARPVVIHGHVFDPRGRAVPDAMLFVRSTTGHAVESTDDEGGYTLTFLAGSEFNIQAFDRAERFAPAFVQETATVDQTIDLTLVDRRESTLRVQDEDGAPVERYAFVYQRRFEGGGMEIWGDSTNASERPGGTAELEFSLEPYYVVVNAPGYAEASAGPFTNADAPDVVPVTVRACPTLDGRVTVGNEPLEGARVTLRSAVPGAEHFDEGFCERYYAASVDAVESGQDGTFSLTLREKGTYFVRAEADDLAAADRGPIRFDGSTTPPPIALGLSAGGAIEGHVELVDGSNPSGTIVGISRGDGADRTLRVDATGAYRFEGLTPGPWLVVKSDTEALEERSGLWWDSDIRSGTDAFAWSCTVEEGKTTDFDLVVGRVRMIGTLTIDGEPALGWNASLSGGLGGTFSGALDSQGRFELIASNAGRRVLELASSSIAEPQRSFKVRTELTLARGITHREFSLVTGTLVAEGSGVGDGSTFDILWVWENTEGLWAFGGLSPGDDGVARMAVPAGTIRIVRRGPRPTRDVRTWETVATVTVTAGGEARVTLL